tara:strand:- start:4925 stop:6055 length:1131 start_codon:yes stop_codon:yes gene_type:complete
MDVIKIPGAVRPGQVVAASDFNALLAAVRALQIRPGVGYHRAINVDGTTLRIKQMRREGGPHDYAPFSITDQKEVAAVGGASMSFEVTLEPGRVICANPTEAADGGDGYSYFIPEIGGVAMDVEDAAGDLPVVEVSVGEGIFCKINRGADGQVIEPVQIVTGTPTEISDHYQPVDPGDASGHPSTHDMIRLVELEVDVPGVSVTAKVWRKSDIQITPFLWTGVNVGGGVGVYQDHDENAGDYNFKGLTGCWGTTVADAGGGIQIEQAAENVGEGETAFAGTALIERATAVTQYPAEEICDQPLRVKSFGQGAGAGERQIRITDGNEILRVHGNGVDGSLVFKDCDGYVVTTLTWQDGLITNPSASFDIQLGDCGGS